MKRKFAGYSFILASMMPAAAYSFQPPGQTQGYEIPPGQKGSNIPQPIPNVSYNPFANNRAPDLGWSQVNQPYSPMPGPPNQKNYLTVMNKDRTVSVIEKEPGVGFTPEEMEQSTQLRIELQSAIATIKSPDSDEAIKKESKALVAQYLKAEFKRDQTARREQVERLEKQVEQLKKQLAKREESQDKLIELRLQLLENDASGLSFPETWANFANNPTPTTLPSVPPMTYYPNVYGPNNVTPGINVGPGGSQYPAPIAYPTNNPYINPPKNSNNTEPKKR